MPFHFAETFLNATLDLFSPPVCFLCHNPTHRKRRALCWDCLRKSLLVADGLCDVCGVRAMGAVPAAFTCSDCARDTPAFLQARAATIFAGDIRRLVHLFKYQKSLWLCNDFADLLHGCFLTHYSADMFDLIVPVPISIAKFWRRHYNQSEFLARELSHRVALPLLSGALARKGAPVSQTTLTRHQRAVNVAHAFRVKRPRKIEGQRILLLDDVFTTGATANACAKTLLRHGARSVHVITVARGMHYALNLE